MEGVATYRMSGDAQARKGFMGGMIVASVAITAFVVMMRSQGGSQNKRSRRRRDELAR